MFWSVCHGKILPDKHKAVKHKYSHCIIYVASLTDAFEDFKENGKIKNGLENKPVYRDSIRCKK